MGTGQSIESTALTRDRARELAGERWDEERFGHHFDGPDAVITVAEARFLLEEAGVYSASTIVEWVPGVGPSSQVVANGRAKTQVSVCCLPAYFA